jgi:hypothetical protein
METNVSEEWRAFVQRPGGRLNVGYPLPLT